MTRPVVAALAAGFIFGCHKGSSDGAPAPSASAFAVNVAASPHPGLSTIADAMAAVDLRVEGRRGTLRQFEPITERQRSAIEAHYKGGAPLPLAFQVVSAGQSRRAVLLQSTRGDAQPLVWLLDADGNVVWSKEHPTGGVKPGVSEVSLASGPDGHVCLAWCNAATASVALRRWAEDGAAFADYDVLHVEACSALSVIYWPRQGWLIAVAWPGGASFQLISENGALVWGRDGTSFPWTFLAPAPVSFALDTLDTVMFVRLGQSGGAASAEYVFATRFSADGRPLWPGPLSLKRLDKPVKDPGVRVFLAPGPDGMVRAELPKALSGAASDVVLDVASDGTVVRQ